ncbi:MAG: septum formation protein Maf, partial [Clostridia bacterium]|nr:septum formation protein Maf [Clostridia bacterium]
EYVKELALRKGNAVLETLKKSGKMTKDTLIIAADTIVAAEGEILGKPKNPADAARMLLLLSGRSHRVISGIALLTEDKSTARAEVTSVYFDKVPEQEIEQYLSTAEPYDKAGAYAIQGFASLWIKGIEGDYFNVVGFPVKCFADLLRKEFGISLASTVAKRKG